MLNKYEAEMRFGLAVIVILLLFLNFGTTYIFFQGKRKVSDQVDNSVLSGLQRMTLALQKNETPDVPAEHLDAIKHQFNISAVQINRLPNDSREKLLAFIQDVIDSDNNVRKIDHKEVIRLSTAIASS